MKRLSTSTILLLAAGICYASSVVTDKLSGLVTSTEGEALVGASILLLQLPDSVPVNVSSTGKNGMFSIDRRGYNVDSLWIVSRMIGFEDTGRMASESNLIRMKPASMQLDEVVVKANRNPMKYSAGRFIYDPAGLRKEVRDGLRLIQLVPLVSVGEGSVSILGKGQSQIYINGKDPHMSFAEIRQWLAALPPSQIKSVEIITEPGASVAASMTGGIVNIILDNPYEGFVGSVTATADATTLPRVAPSLSFWGAYNKGKFSSSYFLSYSTSNRFTHQQNTYDYFQSGITRKNDTQRSSFSQGISGNVKLNYQPSSKLSLGASVDVGAMYAESKTNTTEEETIGHNTTVSHTAIMRKTPFTRPYVTGILFGKWYTDSRGSNLDIQANYSNSYGKSNTDYDFPGNPMQEESRNSSYGWQAKLAYTWRLRDMSVLSAGYEYYDGQIHDRLDRSGTEANDYKYNEAMHSAFLQYNRSLGKYFSFNVGLRLEHMKNNGYQKQGDRNYKNNSTDLFPNVSLNFVIPKGAQNISLSYARRARYPMYVMMNPFVNWTTDNTYTVGNPDLKTTIYENVSLYYSFLRDFTLGGSYSYCGNMIENININDGNRMKATFANIGKSNTVNMFVSYNKKLCSFLRISASGTAQYLNQKGSDDISVPGFSKWFGMLNARLDFNFPKAGLLANLTASCKTPYKILTEESDWSYSLNASVTKYFGPHTITLDIGNLLWCRYDKHFSTTDYAYRIENKTFPMQFKLTYSFVFGKYTVKAPTVTATSGFDARRGSYEN